MNYITTKKAAIEWGISVRRVSTLCQANRVNGAIKVDKRWLIPEKTEKPFDKRYTETDLYLNNYYKYLDSKYSVIMPEKKVATYRSQLNFSEEIATMRQRWYRYKEGFSLELIDKIISENIGQKENAVILDPFLGSGSTILGSNLHGFKGIGFEVNPFSYFLAKCKLTNYTDNDILNFKTIYEQIINDKLKWVNMTFDLPKLSISKKVLNANIEASFMKIKQYIKSINCDTNVRNLLELGWLSTLESVAQYKKAGNGLKRKVDSKNKYDNELKMLVELERNYSCIYSDLLLSKNINYDASIINDTALNLNMHIKNNSIDGVIFSPPYANCFDYTEIYKLELWFGGFINSYEDLKILRNKALHSNLNAINTKTPLPKNHRINEPLNKLIAALDIDKLWDKKIPIMLKLYFHEMNEILKQLYVCLKKDGFVSIVVGNSVYGGIIFPTDILLAHFAEKIGYKVEKIEVDRLVITSSQQYKLTLENKNLIRESVVCLKKV